MKKKLTTKFNIRQFMNEPDFEMFYYNDLHFNQVSHHKHSHYEFYFFLEGDIDYSVNGNVYSLRPGDYLLIPPGNNHKPLIHSNKIPYRRIVLWISESYYQSLCRQSPDFSFGYEYATQKNSFHFRHDFVTAQHIQGKLMELLEEMQSNHPFHELHSTLKTASFLAYINRLIYEANSISVTTYEIPLHLRICEYINTHLTENLTLDHIANELFLDKYHIAHTFKENIGLSIHQYIIKKRLHAIKNGIPFGTPLTQLAIDYGFRDYTSFYRAFKKEYQLSPNEYRIQHNQIEDYKK